VTPRGPCQPRPFCDSVTLPRAGCSGGISSLIVATHLASLSVGSWSRPTPLCQRPAQNRSDVTWRRGSLPRLLPASLPVERSCARSRAGRPKAESRRGGAAWPRAQSAGPVCPDAEGELGAGASQRHRVPVAGERAGLGLQGPDEMRPWPPSYRCVFGRGDLAHPQRVTAG